MLKFVKSITEQEYLSNTDSYTDAIVFTTDTQSLFLNGKKYGKDADTDSLKDIFQEKLEDLVWEDIDSYKYFMKYPNMYRVVRRGLTTPMGYLFIFGRPNGTLGTYQMFISNLYSANGTEINKIGEEGKVYISYRYYSFDKNSWSNWKEYLPTLDDTPTSESTNGITSGGVYNAIKKVQDDIDRVEGNMNDQDNDIEASVAQLQTKVEANTTALQGKQDKLTIDEYPTQNSKNVASSGGISEMFSTMNDNVLKCATKEEVAAKQPLLVSGTNIKTINGESLLGEGDVEVKEGDISKPYPFIYLSTIESDDEDNLLVATVTNTDGTTVAYTIPNGTDYTILLSSASIKSIAFKNISKLKKFDARCELLNAPRLEGSVLTYWNAPFIVSLNWDRGAFRSSLKNVAEIAIDGQIFTGMDSCETFQYCSIDKLSITNCVFAENCNTIRFMFGPNPKVLDFTGTDWRYFKSDTFGIANWGYSLRNLTSIKGGLTNYTKTLELGYRITEAWSNKEEAVEIIKSVYDWNINKYGLTVPDTYPTLKLPSAIKAQLTEEEKQILTDKLWTLA